jgi:hypothetical protein
MSCDVYWRVGILREERGEPDPHREGCADCQREHRARDEIVRALPFLADHENGDSDWETRVWARIARQEEVRPHVRWFVGSLVATAAVLLLASWAILRAREVPRDDAPVIEVTSGSLRVRAMHPGSASSTATVGDLVTITVKPGDAVRIYHDGALVLACPPGTTSGGCVSDVRGLTAEARLEVPGAYALVVITQALAPASTGGLADDLTALVDAGYSYQLEQLWVP